MASTSTPHGPLRVAVVLGGRSGEHEVSVVSARFVASSLEQAGHAVVAMAIDHGGRWADPDTAEHVLRDSGDRTDEVVAFTGRDPVDPRLLARDADVVFPVLHGPFGEDGTIQGLLEMLDVPYVGCDHSASAVCMDKVLTKRLVAEEGLATAAWVEVPSRRWALDRDGATRDCLELGLPLFVKPVRLGSSVGIRKVTEPGELGPAIEAAHAFDHRVIVEEAVRGREIEVAVLGNSEPRAAVPGEVVPGHEFYDYEDKYVDDACQLLAPAPLEAEQQGAARQLAISVYELLGCEGMARVDLFLEPETGALWVNEVNTIPGFTSISMFPRLWGLSGLPPAELVDELVRLALERHRRRAALRVRG